MTDGKKIEAAARRYSEVTDCDKQEALLIEEGFKEGANWAINEFLKNLWHPASEEPRKDVAILVETHNDTEVALRLKEDGHFYNTTEDSRDLFFATEKQEGWINVYLDAENEGYVGTRIYKSKEDAENDGKIWKGYVTTLKIEWGN